MPRGNGKNRLAGARSAIPVEEETMTGGQPSNRQARRAAGKRGKASGPSRADIETLVGLYRAGRLDEAITSARRFTRRWPRQGVGWNVLAASHQAAGRPEEAVAAYRKALEREPGNADAWNNGGLMLAELGRVAEAVEHYDRALQERPAFAQAAYNRGLALARLERLEEAEAAFRRVLQLQPDLAETYNELGNLHRAQGRPADAEAAYRHLLAQQPQRSDIQHNLGDLLREQGRFDEAIAVYRAAVAQRPDAAPIHNGLGLTLAQAGYPGEAVARYDEAERLDPSDVAPVFNRARARRDRGHLEAARRDYEAVLERQPDHAEAWTSLGNLLADQGERKAAVSAYRQALALRPGSARLLFYLSTVKRFEPDDSDRAAIESAFAEAGDDAASLACLHYAAGKAAVDAGADATTVFDHYAEGARHQRALLDYDVARDEADFTALAQMLDRDRIAALRGPGGNGPGPVFVVGMPRSGTTLIEQMLASHARGLGAGERPEIGRIVGRAHRAHGGALADWLADLDGESAAAMGARYREAVLTAVDADRVADKMPANFRYLGLIAAMLPEARIVHMQREPADTCLSCFCNLFASHHQAFSYDLTELGRYYRAYAELMDHWRQALPEGMLLEVRYEDLVTDPECQLQRILAHCDLEWDPACLAFHERRGSVETASADQVRQPLYSHAIGRWRPYRAHLGPLFDALGPLAPTE